jgi:hypothetical protein
MTPGTLVLLHSPLTTVAAWGALPDVLRSYGLDVLAPDIPADDRPPYGGRYVAQAALAIAGCPPPPRPLILVAHSAAGPLLPPIAAAQRAAHRQIGGYVFIDAGVPVQGETTWLDEVRMDMPRHEADRIEALLESGGRFPDRHPPVGLEDALRPHGRDFFTEPLPLARDWPDAPCGYLRTSVTYERHARQARMRDWPVVERDSGHFAAWADPHGTAEAMGELLAAM